jgi:hypothetical protein
MSEVSPSYEQFLQRVRSRELPTSPVARIRTLAKELAEGAYAGHWPLEIYAFRGDVAEATVTRYLEERWGETAPNFGLLTVTGYLSWNSSNTYLITKDAFALLDEAEPSNIFISYRRRDSSAFALLVLARLKMAGLSPFLDMSLVPGEDWQQGLKTRIQEYDYLVLLLGSESLNSAEVVKEIVWAVEAGVKIIPVWHGGFVFRPGFYNLPTSVETLLQSTHTIRVLEESAVGYNNAIVELLNRFGVTP